MRCFASSLVIFVVILFVIASAGHGQTPATSQDISDEALAKAQEALRSSDIPSLIQKAESGDLLSQLVLGSAYLDGKFVKRDSTEAARWFRKGSERGSGFAQCWLGTTALNVTKDYAEAKHWLSKAAEQGNQCGEFFLGAMYHDGEAVSKI